MRACSNVSPWLEHDHVISSQEMVDFLHLHSKRVCQESSRLLYSLKGLHSVGRIPLVNHLFHCLWADQHVVLMCSLRQKAKHLFAHEDIQEPPFRCLNHGSQLKAKTYECFKHESNAKLELDKFFISATENDRPSQSR